MVHGKICPEYLLKWSIIFFSVACLTLIVVMLIHQHTTEHCMGGRTYIGVASYDVKANDPELCKRLFWW